MYNVVPNQEIRRTARQQLRGNWGGPILACFVFLIIVCVIALIPVVGALISLIITGPFSLGLIIYFLKFVRGQQPRFEEIFSGFRQFGKSVGLYLLMCLYIFLWSLLLIVPGIIVSFAYSQVFFILADNPDMKVTEILRTSKAMMTGFKMKLFLLTLSFIGWGILCVLTFGIGYLWLAPYMQTSYVNFYEDVKKAPHE